MATESEKPITDNSPQENPKKTLDPTALQSAKPNRLEDQPNNTTSTQPPSQTSLSVVDSGKDGEDSKNTVATVVSAAADDDPVSDIQKKMRRAERFGISLQLTEQEKRNSRAERFGTASTLNGSEALKKSEELKRKARAERFGLGSSVPTDEELKKKARLGRFAPVSKTDALEEEKRKARMIRFSNPPSSSLSQVNDKGTIEPKAAIAGNAGGGGD